MYDPRLREDTLLFLNKISQHALEGIPFVLDFEPLTRFTAAASLVLFSEVTFSQLASGNDQIIKVVLPKDKQCRTNFRDSKLWDSLKPGGESKLNRLWGKDSPYTSGYKPDLHLDLTSKSLEKQTGNISSNLERAISEAILNVVNHAYYDMHVDPSESVNRWWQYCVSVSEAEQGNP